VRFLIPSQHAGATKTKQSAIDKETDEKLIILKESYQTKKDIVVKRLLDRLLLVKTELHPNMKKL
jgi:V-type H+-transporting ATPase subunit G